jgi:hypothetical protein
MSTKTKIKAWIIGSLLIGIFVMNVGSVFYNLSKHPNNHAIIKDK